MSESTPADGAELLKAAAKLRDGSLDKVHLLEQAMRAFEAANQPEQLDKARTEFVSAACWAGEPERMLVAFAARLAEADRRNRGHDYLLLWHYKWVLLEAAGFERLQTPRLLALLADFERRLEHVGASRRTVEQYRYQLLRALGRREEAIDAAESWQSLPRDRYSDCAACERSWLVRYQVWRGEYGRALALAEALLARRESCAEVPDSTYPILFIPFLIEGRGSEADRYQTTSYRKLRSNRKLVDELARHIDYQVICGRLVRALEYFQRHAARAFTHPQGESRIAHYLAGARLFDRIAEAGSREVRVRLPRDFIAREASAVYSPSALAEALRAAAAPIAAAYDRRNGNSSFSEQLDVHHALVTSMYRPVEPASD